MIGLKTLPPMCGWGEHLFIFNLALPCLYQVTRDRYLSDYKIIRLSERLDAEKGI